MKRIISTLLVALVLSSVAPMHLLAADSSDSSKKELKSMIATAKTAADHRRIAAYYQQQATDLRRKGKDHEEMAAIYQKQPLPYEGKHAYGTLGFSHCRKFADLYIEQAKQAEALASLHEEMAKAAENK